MAIGRISGPLLAKNLLRDGVDLAFETDLLYLDVNNGRIGVRKSNPVYELDVNGTLNASNLKITYTGPGTGVTQLGQLVISSGTIATAVGPVTIRPSGNEAINLVGDTTVQGNFHTTGDITAGGNIYLGNNTATDTVIFESEIASDLVPAADQQYKLGSQERAWLDAYVANVITSQISSTGTINVSPANGLMQINADLRVKGTNPIGTAPVVTNVLFVTVDGDDTNDGRAEDASRACRTITGAVRSPYYRPGTLIRVRSGHYFENNPVLLLPNTAIVGDDLRTTTIEPINKTQDLFHVQSGCYLAQMQFLNGRSGLLPGPYVNGMNRGAYCTAFAPQVGGAKIDVYQSPYIQNCTNQTGPWLIDGTMFVPNQTVQIPQAVGTAMFAANTTTLVVTISTGTISPGLHVVSGPQDIGFFNARTLLLSNLTFIQDQTVAYVNNQVANATTGSAFLNFKYDQAKCYRDVGLIVENIAYDATFGGNQKAVEAGLAYWNGVVNYVEGQQIQTTAAIQYINTLSQYIITNQVAPVISSATSQVINTALIDGAIAGDEIAKSINTIITIINSGTNAAPATFNSCGPETPLVSAELLLQQNRSFLQSEINAYINSTYPTFVYKQDSSFRDVGLIVDAVSQDIIVGGNTKTIEAALSYYTGSKGDSSVAETAIADNLTLLKNIILTGPTAAPTPTVGPNEGVGFSNASDLLTKNKLFLQSEVSAYVRSLFNSTFRLTQTQQNFCYRDVGLIVDAIANDTNAGGNASTVFAALQYYNGSNIILPAGEAVKTGMALDYMLTLCRNIVKNIQNTGLYQVLVPQIITPTAGTRAQIYAVNANVDRITKIINNGPGATFNGAGITRTPINLTPSNLIAVQNSANLLEVNRAFIQNEVIGYIDNYFYTQPDAYPTYDRGKCSRDTGLIVDSLAQDLLFGGTSQTDFTALQYWNQNGYTGQITSELTQTLAAIGYVSSLTQEVVQNITIGVTRYATAQGQNVELIPATVTEANTIKSEFALITTILNTGTAGVTDMIVPNSLVAKADNALRAYNILQLNKTYIQEQAVAYVEATKPNGFVYNQAMCYRDVGYIIDSISFDMLYGGNRQAVQSAVYYYAYSTTGSAIAPTEKAQVTAAYNYIKTLVNYVVQGIQLPNPYQNLINQVLPGDVGTSVQSEIINSNIDLITEIITLGPGVVSTSTAPIGQIITTDVNTINAFNTLESNRDFLATELTGWIDSQFSNGFRYNTATCYRDTGLIVDSLAFDLLQQDNSQITFTALQYWNQAGYAGAIGKELTTTTAAISYAKQLAEKIVVNNTVTSLQTATSQVFNLVNAGSTASILSIESLFTEITTILTNGTAGITNQIVPNGNLTTSTGLVNAFNLLQANKTFIEDEVIAYVDAGSAGFTYNRAKCGRDVELVVDALSMDLLSNGTSQSNFVGLQYWGQGTTKIPGELSTTTAAINFVRDLAIKIITNDTSGSRYQATVVQYTTGTSATTSETQSIYDEFNLITSIINNGTLGVTDMIVPNNVTPSSNPNVLVAYQLLEANKAYIQAEAISFVTAIKTSGYAYDVSLCYRDVGYMVDSVAVDLLYGGNRQAIQSGVYYFNFDGARTAVPNEQAQVASAYRYIKTLAAYVVAGQRTPTQYQTAITQVLSANTGTSAEISAVNTDIDLIINIITNGPSVANAGTPLPLIGTPAPSVVNAATILNVNRSFIRAEVIAYIDSLYPAGYNYDRTTCKRDVGYIIDSVGFDLLHGGNRQSIQSGVYYYRYDPNSSVITYEKAQITAAYDRIKDIAAGIIMGNAVTPSPGNTESQVIAFSNATSTEVDYIHNEINIITDIINNGPSTVYVKKPINLTSSSSQAVIDAYTLLLANRKFIQAELIAYINHWFASPFVYDKVKCYRDTRLIVDSVALDLLYGGNSQSTFTALQYWAQGSSKIPGEQTTTTNAILHALSLTLSTIVGYPAAQAVVTDNFNLVVGIINTGTTGITDMIVPNGMPSTNTSTVAAYNAIQAGKAAIQDQTVQWVSATYPSFTYTTATCHRDVGFIVDCVSFDLLHGGNRQSIQSGAYYYGFSSTATHVANEIPQVVAAYNHLKYMINTVIQNKPLTPSFQTVYPQTIITSYMGVAGVLLPEHTPICVDAIKYLNNISLNVINNTPVPVIRSTATQIFNAGLEGGVYASGAITRNFNIITNVLTNGPNAAPVPFSGSGLFATTGVSSDDVRQSPTILSITTQSGNVYVIQLSGPTVGDSQNGTLYFGNTLVFPAQDAEVEAESLKYTGNKSTWNSRKVDVIGAMGGSLVDGGVVSDRSPIQSFVYDAFTQVNQGGRGIHITNNGYAQLVSVFAIFCSVGVQVDNGGIASIVNSNANFGDICLLSNGYGKKEFSGTVYNPPRPTYVANGQYYPFGYYPQNGVIEVFIPDVTYRPHIALVMEVEPPTTYIDYSGNVVPYTNDQGFPGFLNATPSLASLTTGSITINGIDTTGIAVGNSVYIRDQYGNTGTTSTSNIFMPYSLPNTIVTDVSYQTITLNKGLGNGGTDPTNTALSTNTNYFNLYFCGNAYYTVLSSKINNDFGKTLGTNVLSATSVATTGTDQIAPELVSLQYIADLLGAGPGAYLYVAGVNQEAINFVNNSIKNIMEPIINAASVTIAENLFTPTTSGTPPLGASLAISTINTNIETIVGDVMTYLSTTYPALYADVRFNKEKCKRDVRLLLRQVTYDLETGGNYYSVYTGLSYWYRAGTHHIIDLEEGVANTALFPDGAIVNFYQRSYISASGYMFEYVGAGVTYGALPQRGVADPVQGKEVVQVNNGKVFFTSTDQNGDYRIGPGLVISQATGVLSGRTFTKSLFANMTPFILAIEGGG
jgi:hypothetical protein